jgi:hypothetical protein
MGETPDPSLIVFDFDFILGGGLDLAELRKGEKGGRGTGGDDDDEAEGQGGGGGGGQLNHSSTVTTQHDYRGPEPSLCCCVPATALIQARARAM